ncbi:MAG TPA: hypothetical protein P5092_03455 [Ruminococcus sp.]|nr:hypothetical protein [Ruminococcus sp.]
MNESFDTDRRCQNGSTFKSFISEDMSWQNDLFGQGEASRNVTVITFN